MSVPPTLAVDGLAFAYPGLTLFDGWTHVFAPGVTWLRGDHGCGKSTLLRLLAGEIAPQAGSIRLDGLDARVQPVEYRRRVIRHGGDGPVPDHLKPMEFFALAAGLHPDFDAGLAGTLVESLGLAPFLPRRISELSTGSRRKVGVIAAIASGASVVLLDEPLAGLDRASSNRVKERLAFASTEGDRVWIVVSHDPLPDDGAIRVLDLPARD